MSSQIERYTINGKAVPYRPDNEIMRFAELSISEARFEVALFGGDSDPARCGCEIWEHTIHEMETLSASLRAAAAEPFPQPLTVERPESRIGTMLNLHLAVDMELCCTLSDPPAARARVMCMSRDWGLRHRQFGVSIGMAILGQYREVVVEPKQALDLADWLDRQIAMIYATAE